MDKTSSALGKDNIGKLLWLQSYPAAIGFLLMSLNMVVDAIFVGQYVGKEGIGAVTIFSPIGFLLSSFGMAIGIGASSIISRAFGADKEEKAQEVFNNGVVILVIIVSLLTALGFIFEEQILHLYGAKGELETVTKTYYRITMIGIPFLSIAMYGNNTLRSEGKPKQAMMVLLIPSLINMVLDAIFISGLDQGIHGAGWATTLSYFSGGGYIFYYYFSNQAELQINPTYFRLKWNYVKEIFSIGSISIIRQVGISLLWIFLAKALHHYGDQHGIGGEAALSVYGIVTRISMFAFFPLIGIAQGMVPIVGYNYGANKYDRVKRSIFLACLSGFIISCILCAALLLFSDYIPLLFLSEEELNLVPLASEAISYVFLATFIVAFQLIGANFYLALGKSIPALLLTLSKQVFFLLPLIFILPTIYGLLGIWVAFPMADALSGILCLLFLWIGLRKMT